MDEFPSLPDLVLPYAFTPDLESEAVSNVPPVAATVEVIQTRKRRKYRREPNAPIRMESAKHRAQRCADESHRRLRINLKFDRLREALGMKVRYQEKILDAAIRCVENNMMAVRYSLDVPRARST